MFVVKSISFTDTASGGPGHEKSTFVYILTYTVRDMKGNLNLENRRILHQVNTNESTITYEVHCTIIYGLS